MLSGRSLTREASRISCDDGHCSSEGTGSVTRGGTPAAK